MLTQRIIQETANEMVAKHAQVRETFAKRDVGRKEYEAWALACSEWHALRPATDFMWRDEFMERLRAGEREAVEDAILFLEVDPWFFRSGYLKERLIRGLKACRRSAKDDLRLRNVIWNVVNGTPRREHRKYCSLAARIATDEFHERVRRAAADGATGWKLERLLKFLDAHRVDGGARMSP